MAMFVTIEATIKVSLEVLAASPAEALAAAPAVLVQCRLVKPSFWRRNWLTRVVFGSPPWDAARVIEIVDARAISSVYAGGE
jgi:hypothetical protein